jgi:hypothetical protein
MLAGGSLIKLANQVVSMKKEIVEEVSKLQSARVFMQGAPPPRGWFVKYVSGMEDKPDIAPRFWLTQWHRDSKGRLFNFEPVLDLHWDTEAGASAVSTEFREAGVETAVVRIGA